MPNPLSGDVHVNVPLTNIAVAYLQSTDAFIASKVFPFVPVTKQSNRYFVYNKGDWFRNQAKKRAPSTESAGGGWKIDATPTYFCEPVAIHKDIDDTVRINSDAPIDMDRDATEWVTRQLLIEQEQNFVDTFMQAGLWGTDLTGTVDFIKWSSSTATPIEDIDEAKDIVAGTTGFDPNTLILGPTVARTLKSHGTILERIKYTQRGLVTLDLLASLFGIERVISPRAVINTADEGLADAMQFVFTNDVALLCYVEPSPSILKPSAGYSFVWNAYAGSQMGLSMTRFRMPEIRSDRVEGEVAYDQKLVASDCGVFFTDIL